jgi:murein hydrolase activator
VGFPYGEAIAQTKKNKSPTGKGKSKIQKRLVEFDQILKKTSDTKKASVGQLNAVNKQLQTRITFIRTLSNEVTLINREIKETESSISGHWNPTSKI